MPLDKEEGARLPKLQMSYKYNPQISSQNKADSGLICAEGTWRFSRSDLGVHEAEGQSVNV